MAGLAETIARGNGLGYEKLSKIIGDRVAVNGGGNSDYQWGNYTASTPEINGLSAFLNGSVANSKWGGFKAAPPQMGLKYKNPDWTATVDYQNNVPVDMGEIYRGPNINERRAGVNLNIPFSLGG
jgi:hypothetical protein